MKKIYVIRHANKDKETGELTEEGKNRAIELNSKLGKFDLVIASNKRQRLIDTAVLLAGTMPQIDNRTGIIYSSEEEHEKLTRLAKVHPLSHAGAVFEFSEFEKLAQTNGENLIALIKETFQVLPENGKALIVAQDAVMVAAERITNKKPYKKLETSFKPLEGFIINEDLHIEKLEI